MKKILIKYLLCFWVLVLWMTTIAVWFPQQAEAQAPEIGSFFDWLMDGENAVYDLTSTVDPNKSLRDNIIDLLIPAPLNPSGSTATLWVLIRTIGVGVFILMLVFFASQLLIFWSDEGRVKSNLRNIALVIVWAILFFGAVRILSTIVTLWSGTTDAETIVDNINNNLFLQILWFLKALAFFIAIVALVIAAVRMMSAMDQEDKIKSARRWIINVIAALLFIKLIDFIYYAVAQPNFSEPIKWLIIQAAVILGRILWVVFMLAVIVAGYMMIVDGWSGERVKRARWILVNIFLAGLVIFIFLLVMFQLVNEF